MLLSPGNFVVVVVDVCRIVFYAGIEENLYYTCIVETMLFHVLTCIVYTYIGW